MPGGIGGFAGDYVEAMWLMLQQPRPDDYVVATGETHSVSDFVELAFAEAGLDWRRYVEIDSRYLRPTEVDELRGDASKAREVLRWQPRVPFVELVRMMVATILNSPAATEPYPRSASVHSISGDRAHQASRDPVHQLAKGFALDIPDIWAGVRRHRSG